MLFLVYTAQQSTQIGYKVETTLLQTTRIKLKTTTKKMLFLVYTAQQSTAHQTWSDNHSMTSHGEQFSL